MKIHPIRNVTRHRHSPITLWFPRGVHASRVLINLLLNARTVFHQRDNVRSQDIHTWYHAMAKRPAEVPLEEINTVGSPDSKRARVESSSGEEGQLNGSSPGLPVRNRTNDDTFEQDARKGKDIVAAADLEHEELEEAELEPSSISPDIDEEQSAVTSHKRQDAPVEGYTDLYLDSINRSLLDFDFEKLCSVTLSNINVYACLICGKYFQGRGPKSHAYFHALEVGHHVFVNMQTQRVYVLPEGYEVKSKSLDDIKFVVDPRYSKEDVSKLDREPKVSWDLAGRKYIPGACRLLVYAVSGQWLTRGG